MAVAYTSTYYNQAYDDPSSGVTVYQWSYSVTNTSGNALCLFGWLNLASEVYSEITSSVTSITYGSSSATIDFQADYDWSGGAYGYKAHKFGAHLLNAPTGANNLVITCNQDGAWYIYARATFVSGADTSGSVAYAQQTFDYNPTDDASHTSTLNVPSTTGGLTVGFGDPGGDSSWTVGGFTSGTPTPTVLVEADNINVFPINSYTGTTPNIVMSGTVYVGSGTGWGSGSLTMAGFTFVPSSTPTNVSGVTIVSGITDPGDVTIISGVSVKNTGITLVDFT
jgi:hypothetical protein